MKVVGSTLLALMLLACSEPKTVARTQLMLVADTDITDLETVEFSVDGPDREPSLASATPRADHAPLTLAVVREQGPLGPVYVAALGYRGGEVVVARKAEVAFVEGKTLVVPLHLVASCENSGCAADQTCTETGCAPVVVNALDGWRGAPPTLGAGTTGAMDAALPTVEDAEVPTTTEPDAALDAGIETARDANAEDALVDASEPDASPPMPTTCADAGVVDLQTNRYHCGSCNNACQAVGSNTIPVCTKGACGVRCVYGWGDCNGDPADGCENYLAYDEENCGACARQCTVTQYCSALGNCLKY